MIRAFLCLLYAVLYCILSIPILAVETLIKKFAPVFATTSVFKIVRSVLGTIAKLSGAKITVIGQENIPKDEPVLFVGNHQGFFDVIIGYSLMPYRTAFVAKNSMEKVPLLRWNMRFLSCLFLDREDPKQAINVIKQEVENLKNGISVFVFPEGTRNKGDVTQIAPFHKGSFKPAQRAKCKIVPVAFTNTRAVLERQFPRIKPEKVIVEFGKPVSFDDLTREEQKFIDVYFHDKVQEMVLKNEKLL